jgi:hypothetical protein
MEIRAIPPFMVQDGECAEFIADVCVVLAGIVLGEDALSRSPLGAGGCDDPVTGPLRGREAHKSQWTRWQTE